MNALFSSLRPRHTQQPFNRSNGTRSKSDLEIFYHNLNDSHYDKRIPPSIGTGRPVILKLDLFVQSVGEINEMQMMVTVSVFLRMRWKDPRLKLGHATEIVADHALGDLIWLPDPYFVNGDGEKRGSITIPNRFFRITPDGETFYSQRLTVPFACPMNLTYFPLDKQTCVLTLESCYITNNCSVSSIDYLQYTNHNGSLCSHRLEGETNVHVILYSHRSKTDGHTTEDILFEKMGKGISVSSDIQIAQFKMTSFHAEVTVRQLDTGEFARFDITFQFERMIGHYIFTVYISSVLIICLSWVSFWLDIHAVPARISLGVLCVLTQTTQTMSILGTTPRVSYFKAIDIWMASCMFFTFCALVEFAIANSMARYMLEKRSKQEAIQVEPGGRQQVLVNTVSNGSLEATDSSFIENHPGQCTCLRRRYVDPKVYEMRGTADAKKKRMPPLPKAHIMDRISRVLFPVAFICLNIGYWVTFKALPNGTVTFNS